MRPTKQIYSDYTAEDFLVWKTLFNQQVKTLEGKVPEEFQEAMKTVKFSADHIPNFEEVDEILKPLTGWSIQVVPNMTGQKDFFEALSQKKFTATCWLRKIDELDFLPEPDMFHDLFAHVPLLSNKAYCNFFQGIGELAMEYKDNEHAIELLGRLYWFTIEFGLMKEKNALKIYGAAVISSRKETEYSLSNKAPKYDFDIYNIFKTGFRPDVMQTQYFVINSFQQLQDCLDELNELLPMILAVHDTERVQRLYQKAS